MTSGERPPGGGAAPAPDQQALDLGAGLEDAAAAAARRRRARREAIWRAGARFRRPRCTCNAELTWCLTGSEPPRWIPLSRPGPGLTGNVAAVRDGAARIAVVNPPPEIPGPFYRAHIADCPHADWYRRR